jgi:multidrug efflux pump subunit AcrA (membrane-fusion protein)
MIDSAFAIPTKAVYEDKYVYVIEGHKLAVREIEIPRREIDRIIVNGGLRSGDTLVVEIMQGVAPGMPARPKDSMIENRDL